MRIVKKAQLHFGEVNIATIPAVEACINNLEIRGLDRCRSYGRDGFARHVALSIVATNVHRVGLLLQRKALAQLRRAEHRKKPPKTRA